MIHSNQTSKSPSETKKNTQSTTQHTAACLNLGLHNEAQTDSYNIAVGRMNIEELEGLQETLHNYLSTMKSGCLCNTFADMCVFLQF